MICLRADRCSQKLCLQQLQARGLSVANQNKDAVSHADFVAWFVPRKKA